MASDAEQQRAADREWLEEEIRESLRLGNDGRGMVYIRIRDTLLERDRLETTLDYVASCFHVAVHGIKDAPTWQECDRQPCRTANGRLPSVQRVDQSPSTVATPRQD